VVNDKNDDQRLSVGHSDLLTAEDFLISGSWISANRRVRASIFFPTASYSFDPSLAQFQAVLFSVLFAVEGPIRLTSTTEPKRPELQNEAPEMK
jgi:hypothetical protein